jgi:predicted ATPase
VEHTIAAAVGADTDLVSHVGSKRILVLLDNFEQVIEAAPTVSALCSATPHVKVLVTSREPLHVSGEQCYSVEPLRLDEAELLFEERARAVLPTFRPSPEVRLICERLDSLPLAIELAAARVPLLDPAALLARLEQRLPLLASRSRDAPERQRTLSAAIGWSYELLDEDEQQLFRRLSVFRGTFTLEAAEAVCAADLHAIESLVVKNLVRRRWETGRLLMLDTIREYAWERLHESSEAEGLHRRHADFFSAVARDANLSAGNLAPGGQRLELGFAEQDNFRSALDWAQRTGEIEAGLALATALEQFWVANDPSEGVRRFQALLEHPDAADVARDVRAHGLRAWGSSMHIGGDPVGAERLWEESLALFEQLGDDHGCAVLLHRLSITAMIRGDLARARELVESSHTIHERNDDWWQRTWAHAQTTGTRGAIARESGDDTLARELLAESAELARLAGVAWWQGGMLRELAALRLGQGQIGAAEDDARQSLEIAERLGDRPGMVFAVGLLAGVAAEHGQLERAGRLLGAIERERALAPLGGWQRHADAVWARVRELANGGFESALAVGRELELDDAVAYAREEG